MDFNLLTTFISTERANKYLSYSNNSNPFALYCWNIEMASSIFKLTSNFEVYLRNAIVKIIENNYINGFLDITFLGSLPKELLIEIFKDINDFEHKNNISPKTYSIFDARKAISSTNDIKSITFHVTSGYLIANRTFSFWCRMLKRKDIQNNIHVGFPNFSASKITHKKLVNRCNYIREIRNRICHNENIINCNTKHLREEILFILSLIDDKLADFEREKETISCFQNLK